MGEMPFQRLSAEERSGVLGQVEIESPHPAFLIEKDHAAVSGNLRLVPSGAAQEALAEDYTAMVAIGMLLDEDEPFDSLMERCREIGERANALCAGDT